MQFMYDRELAFAIVSQIQVALEKIQSRFSTIKSVDDFTSSPAGMERLDGICMLFVAMGESLKNLHKVTDRKLLPEYPETDWRGIIGLRDIIAHHYFEIDADQIYYLCTHELKPLLSTIRAIGIRLQSEPDW
jgi:uncharacterized protein with HEPN domain